MMLIIEALDAGRGQVRYRLEDQFGDTLNRGVQTFHATLTRRNLERLLGPKAAHHFEVTATLWPAPWPDKANRIQGAPRAIASSVVDRSA